MPGIGAPRFGAIVNVTYRNITSVNTSSGIRVAALAQQRGVARNITFESFTFRAVRGNGINIDAYGQGIQQGLEQSPCQDAPQPPLPGSCMALDGVVIRDVSGDADKAGQILCGNQCAGLRMERVFIRANVTRCCEEEYNGVLPPGTCYFTNCVGPRAVPDFSGYNCSGAACGGCANTAHGTWADCEPQPCLQPNALQF
eukprot:Hpha_TRINITY_DN16916_c1_g1::TRINITY_DN16916_c1_g1_i11::g.54926::m.54926